MKKEQDVDNIRKETIKEIINIIQKEVGNCNVYVGIIEDVWDLALARILAEISRI